MIPFTLAISLYWPVVFVAAAAGVVLIVTLLMRLRGWWWKLPVAIVLIIGPYLLDVARVRLSENRESVINAVIPTTLLIMMMGDDTGWPYGIVFDRLHKAPERHAMWSWQLDQLAGWCDTCVASQDAAMNKRGIQIAATVASKGSDQAIIVLARAMMHSDPVLALLAFDSLRSMGDRVQVARAEIERIAKESKSPQVLARAAILLAITPRE